MATAVIFDNLKSKTEKVFQTDYPITEVKDFVRSVVLLDEIRGSAESILQTNYPLVEIQPITHSVALKDVLPFRVRFTAIQIQRIGLGNTPAIPLQVIGYSNYIL